MSYAILNQEWLLWLQSKVNYNFRQTHWCTVNSNAQSNKSQMTDITFSGSLYFGHLDVKFVPHMVHSNILAVFVRVLFVVYLCVCYYYFGVGV